MKKWIMVIAAAVLLILLVWVLIPENLAPPGNTPEDNSLNQPGVDGNNNNGDNATEENTQQDPDRGKNDYGVYPGDTAYNFQLIDLEGNYVNLSDYRGKVVVLNFWQTACSWCEEELPLLDELYKTYKDGDVMVLAINIGETKEKIAQVVVDKGFTFPVLLDREAEIAKKYLISSTPTNYIITRQGIISDMHIGYLEYNQMEQYVEAAFRE
jgi:peroxiredoxin